MEGDFKGWTELAGGVWDNPPPTFEKDMRRNPVKYYDFDTIEDHRESSTFKSYCVQIAQLMKASGKKGICTADVHRAYGFANQRLTLSALHTLENTEPIGVLPTRYRFIEQPHRVEPQKCINPWVDR